MEKSSRESNLQHSKSDSFRSLTTEPVDLRQSSSMCQNYHYFCTCVCVWGGGGVRGEKRSCEGVSQDGMCQNHHCCGICVRAGGRGEGW